MNQNPNCDGGHCTQETGEVRVLPAGGDSNIILCNACFQYEIQWRRERNHDLENFAKFKLPTWNECEVYAPNKENDHAV